MMHFKRGNSGKFRNRNKGGRCLDIRWVMRYRVTPRVDRRVDRCELTTEYRSPK